MMCLGPPVISFTVGTLSQELFHLFLPQVFAKHLPGAMPVSGAGQ